MPIKKAKAATESDQTQETIDVSQLINNEMASVERPATTVPETISEPISTVSEPVNATASDMENEHDFEKRIQDDLRQAFEVGGFLDIINTSYGFLRPNFASSKDDVYVSMSQVRKFRLRQGDEVIGLARPPKQNERFHGLLKITKINGVELKNGIPLERKKYSELTPIYPDKQIKMEYDTTILSTRILDMMAPIGFGQRGLIVSPPKAGKTILLKEIANGLAANYPKAHIMALLIGERPEEVTDMKRSIKGEVVASNFDESPEHQTSVA
ncbi:hypothetical protein A2209_03365 [Candidatus Roizmanbacteria bacterium RIFOXYA1_FULL_41_12]|uniref:Rho RNA-BD domain-containing protein n=1 Tax=Candidatus Roizmanbacteria bacterium RIFOXYA1_FULL_41_12 TaxID=1802082 RepID=A0A1F7K9Q3_9BACT|nr:MAG: hypothetical protein A2209_03365 [Candidatus Roizmanbacteria bacterium RIFOXYA1_FULL_41_12]